MNVCVIVAAAGRGSRFGAKHNKIFERLKGRAVFLHSLELFSNRDDVGSVILVVNPQDRDEITEKFGANLGFMSVSIVDGGPSRTESIRNALAKVPDDCDYVAVHDAVRPCVSQLWIDQCFAEAERVGAAILASPVYGTLKKVTESEITESGPTVLLGGEPVPGMGGQKKRTVYSIENTVDREGLWQAQTPQVFRRDIIEKAYAEAGQSATDDAALVEAAGFEVAIVSADARNVKITTPADLKLADAVISTLPKPKPKVEVDNPFGEAKW